MALIRAIRKVGESAVLVIPKHIKELLGWEVEDRVTFTVSPDGKTLLISKLEQKIDG